MRSVAPTALAALAALAGGAGCPGGAVYTCGSTDACDRGAGAFCQPSRTCSVADSACPSQHRYVEHAPGELSGSCVPGDVVTGLALRLGFDEGGGGEVHDASPAAVAGQLLNGVAWIEDGVIGTAVRFDGDVAEIRVDGASTVFGTGSVSGFAWVRSQDPSGSTQTRVLGRGYDDTSYFWINFNSGRPETECRDAQQQPCDVGAGDVAIADGAWHHVGFVIDREGAELRFYVDGRFWSAPLGAPIAALGAAGDPQRFYVGGQDGNPQLSLQGDVDELWMFSRALRDPDVQLLYEGPRIDH